MPAKPITEAWLNATRLVAGKMPHASARISVERAAALFGEEAGFFPMTAAPVHVVPADHAERRSRTVARISPSTDT